MTSWPRCHEWLIKAILTFLYPSLQHGYSGYNPRLLEKSGGMQFFYSVIVFVNPMASGVGDVPVATPFIKAILNFVFFPAIPSATYKDYFVCCLSVCNYATFTLPQPIIVVELKLG